MAQEQYRKIYYPKCPYCSKDMSKGFDHNYGKLVDMATGWGTTDVVLTCDGCLKKYRVTCTIKYNTRKIVIEGNKMNLSIRGTTSND